MIKCFFRGVHTQLKQTESRAILFPLWLGEGASMSTGGLRVEAFQENADGISPTYDSGQFPFQATFTRRAVFLLLTREVPFKLQYFQWQ